LDRVSTGSGSDLVNHVIQESLGNRMLITDQVTGENLKAKKATPATTIVSDGLFSPI
jgi:hypothetical protein